MSEAKYKAGDRVSLAQWDLSEPPYKRLGICQVIQAEARQCESGWMITVKAVDGRTKTLDQNWLVPAG